MYIQGLRLWQTPGRLTPVQAKVIGGLAIGILLIAVSGLFLYDGWDRFVHVTALALLGVANLVLAAGSLLPGERGNAVLRALPPLVLLMFVALIASTATHWVSEGSIEIGYIIVGAIAGGIVPWVLRWTRTR